MLSGGSKLIEQTLPPSELQPVLFNYYFGQIKFCCWQKYQTFFSEITENGSFVAMKTICIYYLYILTEIQVSL